MKWRRSFEVVSLLGLLALAGCYSYGGTLERAAEPTPEQITALSGLDAQARAATLDAMKTRVHIATADLFSLVERSYEFSRSGTVSTVKIVAGHRGDTETLKVALEGAGNIAGKVAEGAAKGASPIPH